MYQGLQVVSDLPYSLADIPMFVDASAAIPMKTMASVFGTSPDPLAWVIVLPSVSTVDSFTIHGSGVLYEDDGDSLTYTTGTVDDTGAVQRVTFTCVKGTNSTTTVQAHIQPFSWSPSVYPQLPSARRMQFHVRRGDTTSARPSQVAVNGSATAQWYVQSESGSTLAVPTGTLVIDLGQVRATDSVDVSVQF